MSNDELRAGALEYTLRVVTGILLGLPLALLILAWLDTRAVAGDRWKDGRTGAGLGPS